MPLVINLYRQRHKFSSIFLGPHFPSKLQLLVLSHKEKLM